MTREFAEHVRGLSLNMRLRIATRMMKEDWARLLRGNPELVARRLEELNREHNERNRALREGLARAHQAEKESLQ